MWFKEQILYLNEASECSQSTHVHESKCGYRLNPARTHLSFPMRWFHDSNILSNYWMPVLNLAEDL